MANYTFTALFTNSGAPVTGLTMSEIALTLVAINKNTGVETLVWNTEDVTVEYTGTGVYGKNYASADFNTNNYLFMAYYSGSTSTDADYAWTVVSSPNLDAAPSSLTDQEVWEYSERKLTSMC